MTLKQWLTEHGMTDEAFAARVGLDRSVITRLKNGRRPSMESAARIADATDGAVTPNDFLGLVRHPEAAE